MTHNTSIPNLNSTILCIFLAEISMKFSSKDTSLRNITHTISFPNQNFRILCLLWAEVVYEGSFKRYLLENYDINQLNSNSQVINLVLILAWNWVWNIIKKRPPWELWHLTLLLQIKFFQFCAYFWQTLVLNFIQKVPPWEIWHIMLQFQIKSFQFCAYFWLKLVWNFIQKEPPWEVWHIIL